MPAPSETPRLHPFPILELPADLANSAWAQITRGLDPQALREVLSEHWPVPADPALARLRSKFLGYHPAGILTYSTRSYLQLDHPEIDKEDEGVGDSYYLGYPAPREEVEATATAAFQAAGLEGFPGAELVEFFALFPDLREDFQTAGHFIQAGEWQTLTQMLSEVPELVPEEPWAKAICLYHARNGDHVILSPSGEVAWWCSAEADVTPIAPDFNGFLDYLTDHLDQRWPLDSYGPD